jgi:hypothetical protein
MVDVKMPDGAIVRFPDDMPATEIRALIERKFPDVAAQAKAGGSLSAMSQQIQGGPGPRQAPQTPPVDLASATAATISGLVNGIPVVGPMAQNASDALMGAGSQLMGGNYSDTVENLRRRRAEIAAQAPIANIAGNVAGAVAGFGGLAALPGGAAAMGLTGPLLGRMANSGLSSAGLSIADSMVRRESPADQLTQGAIGLGVGAAIPGLGAGIKAASRPFIKPVTEAFRGLTQPAKEAGIAVGQSVANARKAGQALTAEDIANARMNGQPLMNVDLGGESTRALMRAAANQSPEARGLVTKAADDRFASQSARTVDFFNRSMGGNVDDLARRAALNAEYRATATPAYKRAMTAPNAQAVWNSDLQQLMQSQSFKRAVQGAEARGSDVAAAQGVSAVRNPFVFGADGSVSLKPGVTPNLQFWDQVKRNLDAEIGKAKRAGDDTTAGDLMALKTRLVNNLDALVPAYKEARGVAAAYFGADNAIDAGRKAFTAPKDIDESLQAFNAMSQSEKDEFGLGMVSQLMDDVRATNNRSNLMRMFDNDARKALMQAALGPAKAKQFEAFTRVEDIMDKMRGALGNSTTTRQLMELGIVGGLSAGAGGLNIAAGGDMNSAAMTAMLVAAGRYGFRNLRNKASDQVLQKVAELLTSTNEADISKALSNAMLSEQHMLALEAIQSGIGVAARGSAMAAIAAQ